MITKYFNNFKEASDFAKNTAKTNGVGISIRMEGDRFVVEIPNKQPTRKEHLLSILKSDLDVSLDFFDMAIEVLDNIDKEQFAAPDLAWTDPETNLTWDIAHLFSTGFPTYEPKEKSKALNKVNYAGYSDWRLPTVNELKTLLIDNLFHLKLAKLDDQLQGLKTRKIIFKS